MVWLVLGLFGTLPVAMHVVFCFGKISFIHEDTFPQQSALVLVEKVDASFNKYSPEFFT